MGKKLAVKERLMLIPYSIKIHQKKFLSILLHLMIIKEMMQWPFLHTTIMRRIMRIFVNVDLHLLLRYILEIFFYSCIIIYIVKNVMCFICFSSFGLVHSIK